MNKTELIRKLAEETQMSHARAAQAVNSLLGSIEDALKRGEKVSLVGFGSFATYRRSARIGRNPKTGETINIGPKTQVRFKAGATLLRRVR